MKDQVTLNTKHVDLRESELQRPGRLLKDRVALIVSSTSCAFSWERRRPGFSPA